MGARVLSLALAVASTALAPACGPKGDPARVAPAPTSDCVPRVEVPPAVPPPEPVGEGCLTHARIENLLSQLSAGQAAPTEVRLVSAVCEKRAYVAPNGARFVFWDAQDGLHGKMSTKVCALPTEACIQRALAITHDLAPWADGILEREAARHPSLWRDADVGAVSFLECDAADEPSYKSIETMLHETNHRISVDRCIYDYATASELCFSLDKALPPGMIAAYASAPPGLDEDAHAWFLHLQETYLVNDGQGIRELLDEDMAYSITSELKAIGRARGLYGRAGDWTYNNLTMIMALSMRYLNELARRDPGLAAAQFGPTSANRAPLLAVLARGEAAYDAWLQVVESPGGFERVFWEEYLRERRVWDAGTP